MSDMKRSSINGASRTWLRSVIALHVLIAWSLTHAAATTVAVASNFLDTANALAPGFTEETGHTVRFVAGSTGKLYAQITQGAPFDVLLSADRETVRKLTDAGLTIRATRFTYAVGALVLWSTDPLLLAGEPAATLRGQQIRHLAIANPDVAPYGAAAVETLKKLGVWTDVEARIVQGQNISDVYLMTATGSATAGFVAASSLVGNAGGSRWPVPAGFHAPIAQDAVLLRVGEKNRAAVEFLDYLQSEPALDVIEDRGYSVIPAEGED